MNFFTLLLLQPSTFDWAKTFLTSPAWTLFNHNVPGNINLFSLPLSCPTALFSVCSNFETTSSVVLEALDSEMDLVNMDEGSPAPMECRRGVTYKTSKRPVVLGVLPLHPPFCHLLFRTLELPSATLTSRIWQWPTYMQPHSAPRRKARSQVNLSHEMSMMLLLGQKTSIIALMMLRVQIFSYSRIFRLSFALVFIYGY